MEMRVDDSDVRRRLAKVIAAGGDPSPALTWFYAGWKAEVSAAWSAIRAPSGGSMRGKTWAPMKPQYKRKDGTVVPAWGGVPKVRGKGMVKGRKRPSGQRVTRSSVINADVKSPGLWGEILTSKPFILGKVRLRIGGNFRQADAYAEHVLVDYKRNPLFWKKPHDQQRLTHYSKKWLGKIASDFNGRR